MKIWDKYARAMESTTILTLIQSRFAVTLTRARTCAVDHTLDRGGEGVVALLSHAPHTTRLRGWQCKCRTHKGLCPPHLYTHHKHYVLRGEAPSNHFIILSPHFNCVRHATTFFFNITLHLALHLARFE